MITLPTTSGDVFVEPENIKGYEPLQSGRTLLTVVGGVSVVITLSVQELEALIDGA